MKKLRNVPLAISLIAGIAILVFFQRFHAMDKAINEQMGNVAAVDLGSLDNGVYAGGFSKYVMSVNTRVAIADSAIVSVDITDHTFFKGHEGLETVDHLIKAQSPKVDAVSGATASSMCIMIAVYRALTSEPVGRIAPRIDPSITKE